MGLRAQRKWGRVCAEPWGAAGGAVLPPGSVPGCGESARMHVWMQHDCAEKSEAGAFPGRERQGRKRGHLIKKNMKTGLERTAQTGHQHRRWERGTQPAGQGGSFGPSSPQPSPWGPPGLGRSCGTGCRGKVCVQVAVSVRSHAVIVQRRDQRALGSATRPSFPTRRLQGTSKGKIQTQEQQAGKGTP